MAASFLCRQLLKIDFLCVLVLLNQYPSYDYLFLDHLFLLASKKARGKYSPTAGFFKRPFSLDQNTLV